MWIMVGRPYGTGANWRWRDAFLRIGGASAGADQKMARFTAAGKRVFWSVEEVSEPVSRREP